MDHDGSEMWSPFDTDGILVGFQLDTDRDIVSINAISTDDVRLQRHFQKSFDRIGSPPQLTAASEVMEEGEMQTSAEECDNGWEIM